MNELNPNHPVTAAVHDHWHKIVALLIAKFDLGHVVITQADLAKLDQGSAVVIKEQRDGLHVWMVNEGEAERLARQEGGLPA
jgi:hypothetical protein